jgi:hypothetical protein
MLSLRNARLQPEPTGCAMPRGTKRLHVLVGLSRRSPNLTTFANLRVLALPISVHDGEDQKDLTQPNMHF